MEELYQQGKIRAIGVSNFQPDRLMDLMIHNQITPAVNQIEVNPFQQQIDNQKFCKTTAFRLRPGLRLPRERIIFFKMKPCCPSPPGTTKVLPRSFSAGLSKEALSPGQSTRKERMLENISVFDFDIKRGRRGGDCNFRHETSSFFDHRDPKMVKWLGERKLDV